jgi:hypothetical protein
MISNRTPALAILVAAGCALAGITALRAAEGDVDAATKAKIAEFDKGPATVDVSAYPVGIQKDYAVFREKCTLCHTLARPINSDFALPDEWSRYIKRMMHKPGSMISAGQAKKIYDFLVYDASIRKKPLLDGKLAGASPADKQEAENKIKALVQAYGQP